MNITQIEQAIAIASEGSINKAAKKLFLSQPNLSYSLKTLEKELDFPLFERTGSGMKLTCLGREFLSFARAAYKQFKLLDKFCETIKSNPPITLTVAMQYIDFVNKEFIKICAANSDKNHHFSLYIGAFHEVIERIKEKSAEVGIIIVSSEQKQLVSTLIQKNKLTYQYLSQVELSIILRKNHPLNKSGKESLCINDLKNYPLVISNDSSYSLSLDADDIKKRIVVNDSAILFEIIENTDAFSISVCNKKADFNKQKKSNIKMIMLNDNSSDFEIGFVTNKSQLLSDAAKCFINNLINELT